MITKASYLARVKDTVREYDLVTADALNKIALESETIPPEYYKAAIQILVDLFLN